jgi:hypothetical protein
VRRFRYEHRSQPLLPRRQFLRRLAFHALAAAAVVAGSLGLGVLGYHVFEGLPWLDALLNASMILAGMGPVDTLHSSAAKVFASFYALFSGVVFLVTAGLLVAPVAHRLLHALHLEAEDLDEDRRRRGARR